MDALTIYINCARIIARRDWERDKLTMAMEIKGLGSAVQDARKGIADARAASAGVGESARKLVSALGDVKKQLDAAHDDLQFEAQTLGNSGSENALPASNGTAQVGASSSERAGLHDTKEG